MIKNIFDILTGGGEKPSRVFYSSLIAIVIFAILHWSIALGTGVRSIVAQEKITGVGPFSGGAQYAQPVPPPERIGQLRSRGHYCEAFGETFKDLGMYLYFSAVTFTTLGYGDYAPSRWLIRTLSSIEAYIGAFLIALFAATVFSKYVRSKDKRH